MLHHGGKVLGVFGKIGVPLQQVLVHDHGLLHVLAAHLQLLLHRDGDEQLSRSLASLPGERLPRLLRELQKVAEDLLHLVDHELVDLDDLFNGNASRAVRVAFPGRVQQFLGARHHLIVVFVLHQQVLEGGL